MSKFETISKISDFSFNENVRLGERDPVGVLNDQNYLIDVEIYDAIAP